MKIKLSNLLYGYATIAVILLAILIYSNKAFALENKESESSLPIMTLEEIINLAIDFSPTLESSKAGMAAAMGSEKQAGYWSNPKLAISVENVAGNGQFSGSSLAEYSYAISQSIDVNGKRSIRKKFAGELRKAANGNILISKLQTILNVRIAYFELLTQIEILNLEKEKKILAKKVLNAVSRRVSAARESEIQKVKANVAYENSIIEIANQQQKLQFLRQRLANLIGKKKLELSLDNSDFFNLNPPNSLESYQALLKNSPILRNLDHLSRAKRLDVDLEIASKISDPVVNIGIRDFGETGEQALFAGVSIPLPIYGFNSGNIDRARAELRKTRSDQLQSKISLEESLVEFWRGMQASYLTATKLKQLILPESKKAFDMAKNGYEKGKFSYLEVLDAQRGLFMARSQYYQALNTYHVLQAKIEFITNSNNKI